MLWAATSRSTQSQRGVLGSGVTALSYSSLSQTSPVSRNRHVYVTTSPSSSMPSADKNGHPSRNQDRNGNHISPWTEVAQQIANELNLPYRDPNVEAQSMSSAQHYPPVDVCYLDPMFPLRTVSAAVKKNMQILHSLLESQQPLESNDDDQLELLEAALRVAQSRVVVKRPIYAPPLGTSSISNSKSPKPSFEICGSVNRIDVYVTKS